MSAFVRFISLRVLSGCGVFAVTSLAMGNVDAPSGLVVSTAAEISFPTEKGKVYQLQASSDMKSWPDVGDPIYGTGTPFQQCVAAPTTSADKQFFRLKETTRPTGGLAPWEIFGVSLEFNEGVRTIQYSFNPEGKGSWKSGEVTRTFKWAWLRNGADAGQVTITWADNIREDLKLEFTAPLLGRFVREEWSDDQLEDTDSGTFGAAPASDAAGLPQVLKGRNLALADGGSVTALQLSTESTGTRLLEKVAQPVTYSWLITGNGTMTFNANFSATHGEEYKLTFIGLQSGRFVRKTFTEGILRDEDTGVFTLSGLP